MDNYPGLPFQDVIFGEQREFLYRAAASRSESRIFSTLSATERFGPRLRNCKHANTLRGSCASAASGDELIMSTERPKPGEYNTYYDRYISLIPGTDIVGTLFRQSPKTVALLSNRSEQDGELRYAPGKWSVKEAFGHLIDTERIMTYRALRIARGDSTPMEGFEQDDYVRDGPYSRLRLADLVEEFKSVRAATLAFFQNLREEDWLRKGVANKNDITVRALAYIIAGHELHHRNIFEERYFGGQARAGIA
jgi:DinB superfamily